MALHRAPDPAAFKFYEHFLQQPFLKIIIGQENDLLDDIIRRKWQKEFCLCMLGRENHTVVEPMNFAHSFHGGLLSLYRRSIFLWKKLNAFFLWMNLVKRIAKDIVQISSIACNQHGHITILRLFQNLQPMDFSRIPLRQEIIEQECRRNTMLHLQQALHGFSFHSKWINSKLFPRSR